MIYIIIHIPLANTELLRYKYRNIRKPRMLSDAAFD